MTRSALVALGLILWGLVSLAGAAPVSAHAQLLGTSPDEGEVLTRTPEQVEFHFNEPVTPVPDAVRLFVDADESVTLDAVASGSTLVAQLPELDDGGYAVSYRVTSADGHPVSGAVTFTIGEEAVAIPVPETGAGGSTVVSALTGLHYLGLLVFAGLVLFRVLVTREIPGNRQIGCVAGLVAVVAAFLLIPATAFHVSGGMAGVSGSTVVVAAVTFLGVLLARGPGAWVVGPALLALSTPVLVGHTRVMDPGAVIVAADIVHLWAAAFWVGGIIGLLPVLRGSGGIHGAARAVARFSRFAAWSVLLLAGSGLAMALVILDEPATLFSSTWGRLLLAKIGLLLPLPGLAAYNRFRLVPALGNEGNQWLVLRRTLAVESVLLALIVATTGFLSNQAPRAV